MTDLHHEDTRTDALTGLLDGATVLFAHPGAELYGSDRVLVESVAGVVRAGGRAVVSLPVRGSLEGALQRVGAEVVLCETPVLRKSMLKPRAFLGLLRSLPGAVGAGRRLVSRVQPDVIFVNTVTNPLWIAVGALTRRPVLSHVHEAEGSASRAMSFALNGPLLLSGRIIANSRYSVSILARSFPRLAARTRVVYNGIPGPSETTDARQNLEGGLRILYVGRLSDRKGVDVVIDALAELDERGVEASLDILGAVFTGYEGYHEQLLAQIERLGLGERVRMLGFESDVWPRIAHSDVVVVPSRVDEPFGNTAVEAVLGSRPVIVSRTSGLVEAAEGYLSAQSFTPGDPAALADCLQSVAATWASTRENAALDARRAAERHSPLLYQQNIARVVSDLVPTASKTSERI